MAIGGDISVALFVVCDYAAVSPGDQKLYVAGANIDNMYLRELPAATGQLYLAVLVKVPWHLTGEPIHMRVRLLDSDRQAIGPDPLLEASAEVGRPPGSRAGDELGLPLVLPLMGIPIERETKAFFHLELDGEVKAVYPFAFRMAPPGVFPPAAG